MLKNNYYRIKLLLLLCIRGNNNVYEDDCKDNKKCLYCNKDLIVKNITVSGRESFKTFCLECMRKVQKSKDSFIYKI